MFEVNNKDTKIKSTVTKDPKWTQTGLKSQIALML